MKASDFILQTRSDLQEKSEHWKDEELLLKLQRAYVSLQFDLPCFIAKQSIAIVDGKQEYYLDYTPIKNVALSIDNRSLDFATLEFFYVRANENSYTFDKNIMLLGFMPTNAMSATIVYKYAKELATENCEIEVPNTQYKALRLLFLSEIHEKPTRNSKERVLSLHYLRLYEQEMMKLKVLQPIRAKNITSNYQRI
ncbi:MAG: hypothetical protein RQ763_00085 [Sulfurimonas sp.]|uniref:hypothetical protein n=1 Tax=Sulfurimonas sp. TaxID=2022749 RepID=UPI0028CE4940|nr:hypothetical protein [Sulfurimonas sp.]MDT8337571.1 hypothetical protein [Sulfurimonas sp.]